MAMTDTTTDDPRAGLDLAEVEALHRAVSVVAGACDGASQADGQGFSKPHTDFGRMIAGLPPEVWTADVIVTAYTMMGSYRGQLKDAGIDYADLRVPNGVARRTSKSIVRAVTLDPDNNRLVFHFGYSEYLNGKLRAAGAHWSAAERRWWMPLSRIDAARALAAEVGIAVPADVAAIDAATVADLGPAAGTVSLHPHLPGKLLVSFHYSADMVARVKGLADRRYSADGWVVADWQRNEVLAMALEFGWRVDADVAAVTTGEVPPRPVTPVEITERLGGDYLGLSYAMNGKLNAAVKGITGARWSNRDRCWLVPIEAAHEVRALLTDDYPLDHASEDVLARALAVEELIALSGALDADLDVPETVALPPRPFQRAGVAYALRQRRVIIGDDMGLGKTAQALIALEADGAFPAVVVTPGFLKGNWVPEIRKWLPHRNVVVVNGRKPRPFGLIKPDIVLINYDLLDARPNDPAEPKWTVEETTATGWTRALAVDLDPVAVVADEAQYLRGTTTKRAVAMGHLGDAVRAAHPDALLLALSGTPVVNRRSEVWPILRFLGRHTEFGNGKKESLRRIPDLPRKLKGRCMVRRLKKDVLSDLPARQYNPLEVQGDADVMAEYRRAERKLLDYLAERARKIAEETGLDPADEAFKARIRAGAAEHLVAVNVLRQLAARARLAAAKEWVGEFLASGRKLLVFAHHTAIVDELGATFDAEVIKGGMTNAARMAAVAAFQTDPDVKMLVISITAGGAGLTLTEASDVLFMEQGWSPADMDQALDRCYGRLNDAHGATGWVPMIPKTIDVDMATLIEEKRAEVTAAIDGHQRADDEVEGATSVLSDLVVRMTERATERA